VSPLQDPCHGRLDRGGQPWPTGSGPMTASCELTAALPPQALNRDGTGSDWQTPRAAAGRRSTRLVTTC
jgi:hypothetical protein